MELGWLTRIVAPALMVSFEKNTYLVNVEPLKWIVVQCEEFAEHIEPAGDQKEGISVRVIVLVHPV
jgi:hypothetical protein